MNNKKLFRFQSNALKPKQLGQALTLERENDIHTYIFIYACVWM